MTTTNNIGDTLVSLCRDGKSLEAIHKLYADDVVSVEAAPMPGYERETRGKAAVEAKATFWSENTDVHSFEAEGPFPHGDDKFAVIFKIDATMKQMQMRNKLEEIAIYEVKDGKIVREEFYFNS